MGWSVIFLMTEQFEAKLDCRWFIGEKPCRFKRLCAGCPHYDPMGARVLVIKLAAMGDVLRTTCLLPSLAQAFERRHVTWVTDPSTVDLLKCSPGIDLLLPWDLEAVTYLTSQSFDLVLSLDKEPRGTALAEKASAPDKRGFGLSQWGTPRPLNPSAQYAFRLGLDDELKFRQNRLTYQQIIHQAVDLPGPGPAYAFEAPQEARIWADGLLNSLGVDPARAVGLNTGAGPLFAHKAWLPERFAALADWLREEKGLQPVLLGGPAERELNRQIASLCRGPVADTQGRHDLIQFAALCGRLRLLVTSDSLAMHLALAQEAPCVILFGSTCTQEIMLTGPGRLLSARLECQPCYRRACTREDHCMLALSQERVREAVSQVLAEAGVA